MNWTVLRYNVGILLTLYVLAEMGMDLYKIFRKEAQVHFSLKKASIKRLFVTREDIFWIRPVLLAILLALGLCLLDFFGLITFRWR